MQAVNKNDLSSSLYAYFMKLKKENGGKWRRKKRIIKFSQLLVLYLAGVSSLICELLELGMSRYFLLCVLKRL